MPDPVSFPMSYALVVVSFNKRANCHLVGRVRICELAKLCLGGSFIQPVSSLCCRGESLQHPAAIDHLTGIASGRDSLHRAVKACLWRGPCARS